MMRTEYGVMLAGHGGSIVPQFSTEEAACMYGYSRKIGFVVMRQERVFLPGNKIKVSPWESVGMCWSVEEARDYLDMILTNSKKRQEDYPWLA